MAYQLFREEISPDKANELLATACDPKNIAEAKAGHRPRIDFFAGLMRDRRWRTPHPENFLRFDRNGRCRDGLVRLISISESGVPVATFIEKWVD
jgi:hypothetical protein